MAVALGAVFPTARRSAWVLFAVLLVACAADASPGRDQGQIEKASPKKPIRAVFGYSRAEYRFWGLHGLAWSKFPDGDGWPRRGERMLIDIQLESHNERSLPRLTTQAFNDTGTSLVPSERPMPPLKYQLPIHETEPDDFLTEAKTSSDGKQKEELKEFATYRWMVPKDARFITLAVTDTKTTPDVMGIIDLDGSLAADASKTSLRSLDKDRQCPLDDTAVQCLIEQGKLRADRGVTWHLICDGKVLRELVSPTRDECDSQIEFGRADRGGAPGDGWLSTYESCDCRQAAER